MALGDIIQAGMNNPDCSFFVGQMVGQSLTIKSLLLIALIGFLYKAIDKLAWSPVLDYIKKRLYKR